jgi:DNA-binding MarR family transcriptional regulator
MTTNPTITTRRTLIAARAHKLGLGSLSLMCLLHEHGSVKMAFAARECSVSSSNLTGLADTLHSLGFAISEKEPLDRRQVTLSLTPLGCLAIEAILEGRADNPQFNARKSLGLRLTR